MMDALGKVVLLQGGTGKALESTKWEPGGP